MTGKVSKRKVKRACIDCHFLAEEQNDTEEVGREPYEIESKVCHYYVEADRREPIRRNDYSWIQFPLVCYRGCWRSCSDKEKQHEEVVEIDRSGCPLFFEYKQGMSFEAAEKTQDRTASLQSSQNKKKEKVRKACIGCHFLMSIPQLDCGVPPIIGFKDNDFENLAENNIVYDDMKNTIVDSNARDWILKYLFNHPFIDYRLGCYHEFWIQSDDYDVSSKGKLYEVILEIDRSGCIFFLEYHPDMSFEAAEKVQERKALLQASQNKSKSNKTELKTGLQEVKSIETTLSYNKTTGKFRFGKIESVAVSKTSRTRVSNTAEKLMKWWAKGKPCPQSEIVKDPARKTPQGVHDDISKIRKALEPLGVNMLQCISDGYPPPEEPKHFNIISKKVD